MSATCPHTSLACAARIREARAPLERPAILLTAHSIPRRVHDTEPGYVEQLRRTADLVARAAGLAADDWHFAFQSAGHTQEEWLRPDLVELFPGIAAGGARNILILPIQFLADHLEVLYDLDVAAGARRGVRGARRATGARRKPREGAHGHPHRRAHRHCRGLRRHRRPSRRPHLRGRPWRPDLDLEDDPRPPGSRHRAPRPRRAPPQGSADT